MKKQTLYWTKGLPACGKSTLATEMMNKSGGRLKRVNKDLLRLMLDGSEWSNGNKKNIIEIRNLIISKLLNNNYDVISDDTNFHPKHEEAFKEIQKEFDINLELLDMTDVPLQECITRDSQREKSVGKKVILGMYNEYLAPDPVPVDEKLDSCFIVDLDGTLADNRGRSPFDDTKYIDDKLHNHVFQVIDSLWEKHKIIVVSGREATELGEKSTKEWLDKHRVRYDYIYMRKFQDKRPDDIVKKEIYETNIRGKFNVIGIFDDRPKVVQCWRSLGLPVFDCGYGIEF